MSDKKKSKVWLHFTVLSSEKAKCDICKNVFSYKGGSTSNLQKHLKAKHFSVLHENESSQHHQLKPARMNIEEPIAGPSSAPDIPNFETTTTSQESQVAEKILPRSPRKSIQTKMSTFSIRPASLSRTKMLNGKVLNMILQDLQPFSVVEDTGFKALIAALDPTYQLPSRKTFSGYLLNTKYEDVVSKVKSLLNEAEFITVTTDTWTSRSVENYMAVTAHYLNKEWTQKSLLLGCFHFSESHTAENIRNKLLQILNEWDISNKIEAVVTDNARNITAAIKLTGWPNLPCLAHTLNLVVQDALKLLQPIQKKVKKIVEYFHRSTTAAEKLNEMQTQMTGKTLKLINDVITRWNSTYFMFSRICEVQVPLEAALGILHNPVEALTAAEWSVLNECSILLKPFEQVTRELSAEKNVCVSKIIPLIESLKQFLRGLQIDNITASELKDNLVQGLATRFHRVEYNVILAKATYLDPRFKRKAFSDENAVIKVRDDLMSEISRLIKKNNEAMEVDDKTSLSDDEEEAVEEDSIWKGFDAKISRNTSTVSASIIETKQYAEEHNIKRKDDPLKWWKTREAVYPNLAKLAQKYLSVTATSVPSERVFSKAGQVVSDRRSRLKPKNVEKVVFLNGNSHLF